MQFSWFSRRRSIAAATAVVAAAGTAFGVQAFSGGASAAGCANMTTDVRVRANPSTGATLYTLSGGESDKAVALGFTTDLGVAFRAANTAGSGNVGVHRLYQPKTHDFVWVKDAAEITSAQRRYGYVDQGVYFHAAPASSSCNVPIYRLQKGANHRFAVTTAERSALQAAGWTYEMIAFYAAPVSSPATSRPTPSTVPTSAKPTTTTVPKPSATATPTSSSSSESFTLVSMPDTQREVNSAVKAPRFTNRMTWLAQNKAALNLKYVWQVGDLQDWDDSTHSHYLRGSKGLSVLDSAGIPYSLALGNHDTAAVCTGGSACPGAQTWVTVRNTETFNSFYPTSRLKTEGTYEPGKVDNAFKTFSAGGVKFMVLNLELWARPGAVDWAKSVVASHPHHNVIVITHGYLNADGSIQQNNGGYGSTSPQYVFDNLIKQYPNIKFVFSGHTGTSAMRTDTGVKGNTIVSMLDCYHSESTNPMRLLTVNVGAGTVSSKVYAPFTNETGIGKPFNVSGISWVR